MRRRAGPRVRRTGAVFSPHMLMASLNRLIVLTRAYMALENTLAKSQEQT
jgi:hypothetical protein